MSKEVPSLRLNSELIALELRPRRSNEYYAVRKWLPGGEEQGWSFTYTNKSSNAIVVIGTHPNEAGDYCSVPSPVLLTLGSSKTSRAVVLSQIRL